MNQDSYQVYAERALGIMEIRYEKEETLEQLADRIRYAIRLPATSTEFEISRLSHLIANEITNRADPASIESLLEKLDFEVSFLLFD